MLFHVDLPAPCEPGIEREVRAIITDDHTWFATFNDEVGQFPHEPTP